MLHCAILDDYQGVARSIADWSALDGRVALEAFRDHLADRDALAERLRDFEIVVAMRERTSFDAALLDRLPKLKLLVTTGMRNAAIDMAAAAAHGVVVCGTDGSSLATAELTWALIHTSMRGLPDELASVRGGGWQRALGGEVAGKALGVVGFGRLGSRVAKIGVAFGMTVSAWSRNLTDERVATVPGVARAESLDALLRGSDVLTIHLVLNQGTSGLIGAAELARMKPTAWLVNTSRGPIIDEAALVAALRARQIAGAALDVFDTEPLPEDHPFRGLDNVIASPHIGYVTRESYNVWYSKVVEDILAWLDGKPVRVVKA
jgi:phosphoglycerate dehydrogenase-like enzyme